MESSWLRVKSSVEGLKESDMFLLSVNGELVRAN